LTKWEAFSKTFYVKSPDKKWAYDVIHQKTMEYLMSAPDYKIEMQGQNVLAYSHRLFSVNEFDQALAMILSILALLPDSVLSELRGA
jgi:hypothetical protein